MSQLIDSRGDGFPTIREPLGIVLAQHGIHVAHEIGAEFTAHLWPPVRFSASCPPRFRESPRKPPAGTVATLAYIVLLCRVLLWRGPASGLCLRNRRRDRRHDDQ